MRQDPLPYKAVPRGSKECPNACSGWGNCNHDTGLCECPAGEARRVVGGMGPCGQLAMWVVRCLGRLLAPAARGRPRRGRSSRLLPPSHVGRSRAAHLGAVAPHGIIAAPCGP